MTALPPEAWAIALADLPDMGPSRLRALLGRWSPEEAHALVRSGRWTDDDAIRTELGTAVIALRDRWRAAAAEADVEARWHAHMRAGVGVAILGSAGYPAELAEDVEPPALLVWRGDPDALAGPRVAIVGTRQATGYGTDVAFELGHDLAAAGVAVVSGLALGIDGAAHAGALAAGVAPAIGVVGSGLDVVYPADHGMLWHRVGDEGLLLSEVPLGGRPTRWRFPARNRIIAALADAVVVVESRAQGGSMHTVDEAIKRERLLYAVPGSVRSPASAGTNRLLGEGALPVADATDVLLGLGLTSAGVRAALDDPRPTPAPQDLALLEAIGWQPATIDQLVLRTSLPLGTVAGSLERLLSARWVRCGAGWWERVARGAP